MGYLNSDTKGSTNYAFNGGSQFIVCDGGNYNELQYTFTNPTGFAVTDSDFNKSITYRFLFQNCWFSTSSTATVTLGGKKIMSVQPDLTNSSINPASNGLIKPLPRHQMTIDGSNRYYAITANTVLEMYYDSSLDSNNGAWVIVGNPIVMSASNYTVYANGKIEQCGRMLMDKNGNLWKTVTFYVNYNNKPFVTDTLTVNSDSNVEQQSRNQHVLHTITTSSFSIYCNYGNSDVYSDWKAEGY